jgi:LPXTG-motif cell wall-anchored protein
MTAALHRITILLVGFCLFVLGAYVFLKKRERAEATD